MDDEVRSSLSKTVAAVRGRYQKSNSDAISIDGISINGDRHNGRARSNLRTINEPARSELSSFGFKKKSISGIQSPAPKRSVLDDLNLDDKQRLLSFSMAKINKLNKDDLLRAISIPSASPMLDKLNHAKRLQLDDNNAAVDEALKKLARGADDYPTLKEYCRTVI